MKHNEGEGKDQRLWLFLSRTPVNKSVFMTAREREKEREREMQGMCAFFETL